MVVCVGVIAQVTTQIPHNDYYKLNWAVVNSLLYYKSFSDNLRLKKCML